MFGNLIDRILHAGVIDYLSFEFFGYGFPIFNIADIGITVGVTLMLIEMLLEKKRRLQ
jgi:signal peptidase II